MRQDIVVGDCREVLRSLPAQSVQCCVTSPPYFWMRQYLPADVVRFRHDVLPAQRAAVLEVVKPWAGSSVFRLESVPQPLRRHFVPMRELGHEETVDGYVAELVAAFREVRRVLRKDGAVWLNLGDAYYSGIAQSVHLDPRYPTRDWMRRVRRALDTPGWDVPKKSLLGLPWKVAHALQVDGWTVRAEVIWCRTTAMAEPSAKDRPHRQHETLFLLSQSPRYFFDRSALPEETVWHIPHERQTGPGNGGHAATYPTALARRCIASASREGDLVMDPFLGIGTTLCAAKALGRRGLGIELSPEHAARAQARVMANNK
jgi:DNA modification methylase